MNYVTQLGFDLADAKAELASANSKISELENKLRATNAGQLDWRESAKEKPEVGRFVVTHTTAFGGIHSAFKVLSSTDMEKLEWDRWAYFNPPTDPAEEAWEKFHWTPNNPNAPEASESIKAARRIFVGGYRAAKEAK